jgi:hypothetical protein
MVLMIKVYLFFYLILMTTTSYSLYNPGQYGEKDFDLYYGAMELGFEKQNESIVFKESEVYKNYSNNLIEPSLIDFQTFFSFELAESLSCPNSEMTRMYDYLRFANRVLALSYLFEANLSYQRTGLLLGDNKVCPTSWKKQLNRCSPKTSDMKLFIKSAKHITKEITPDIIPVTHSIKSYQSSWIRKLLDGNLEGVSHYRIKQQCKQGNCSDYMNYKTGIGILNQSCLEDLKLFNSICSETDNLFGLSQIQESYSLIKKSDILEVADTNGFASGCLRRFKNENKNKEVKSSILNSIFPILYQDQIKKRSVYLQGRLFPAGSLKLFVDKGLVELFKEETKKISAVTTKKISIAKKPLIVDKVEFIDRYVKKKRKKISKKRTIYKKVKPKVFRTSFLIASDMRKQMDMNRIEVDMLNFKYEFMFSINLKKMLDDNLQMYITRSGLEQMKRFDKLGSKEAPLPLMFLKYLIETKKHQALYNIKSVLGDRFYVNNDIDENNPPAFDYIELRNDDSTNLRWQIDIISEPEVTENSIESK